MIGKMRRLVRLTEYLARVFRARLLFQECFMGKSFGLLVYTIFNELMKKYSVLVGKNIMFSHSHSKLVML